ncbi:RNA polymerase sigma-70 factor [Mucilaginibacter rubeus]|uniref:RNA polymerase sigma-70 factor n=1 Tax=Mucilaginibacter rubeus TaxID=2027860 RepID=UPI00166775BD|nr:RNA polymerase sigma-70 factor [Mucilaginibacter rubeus]GGA96354.1 DNA-directed RNA polymerase sigma-70 factor [Mucilaginibacter rubeus]
MPQYANYDDRELANLLRQHDHKAFNEIYRRYWKKMLLIAWNHSQDNGIAKDIVQEVFVNLWQRCKELHIDNLPAFLATAIKFQVFKYYQKEQRRSELAKENYLYNDISLDEEKLDARFLEEFINGIVEEMPEKCRLVFRCSRTQGLKNSEIAELINISEKGVENTLTRALKIIRCELKNHGISLLLVLQILDSLRK